jgi:transcription initiation factor TFIID TATA-box-binding protein
MEEITVENVVVSITFKQKIPIEELARKFAEVEYEPEQFPGMIWKLDNPKCSFLIFPSGRIICTGARKEDDVKKAIDYLLKKLKEVMNVKDYEIQFENVVTSVQLNGEIDLNSLAYELENSEYEPEQFPGLIYRKEKPKCAILIFKSGKIVCTGIKNIEESKKELKKFVEFLKNSKCFKSFIKK